MKREYPFDDLHPPSPQRETATAAKGKLWVEEEEAIDGGMDELLAVLGYKVRSSDMAEVAQKLEQLEEFMGQHVQYPQDNNTNTDANTVLSHLSNDTVHYNPSDLSSWLEIVLSEFNNPSLDDSTFFASNNSSTSSSSAATISTAGFNHEDYDLKAIPGKAVFNNAQTQQQNKRIRHNTTTVLSSASSSSSSSTSTESTTRPLVLVDSQENGVRLVHLLLACAEAVEHNNLTLADALVKEIGYLAVSQAGAMRKLPPFSLRD